MCSPRDDRASPRPGSPIRTPRDQRSRAAPPGLSQLATSFIAGLCLGIHPVPLPLDPPLNSISTRPPSLHSSRSLRRTLPYLSVARLTPRESRADPFAQRTPIDRLAVRPNLRHTPSLFRRSGPGTRALRYAPHTPCYYSLKHPLGSLSLLTPVCQKAKGRRFRAGQVT
jgi:hypothetical protein